MEQHKFVATTQDGLLAGQSLKQNLGLVQTEAGVPVQRCAAELEVFDDDAQTADQQRVDYCELVGEFEYGGVRETMVLQFFVELLQELMYGFDSGGEEGGEGMGEIEKSQDLLVCLDVCNLGEDILHEGCVLLVGEEVEVEEPEGFVGVLLEDDGCLLILHFGDFGDVAAAGPHLPGRRVLHHARKM